MLYMVTFNHFNEAAINHFLCKTLENIERLKGEQNEHHSPHYVWQFCRNIEELRGHYESHKVSKRWVEDRFSPLKTDQANSENTQSSTGASLSGQTD